MPRKIFPAVIVVAACIFALPYLWWSIANARELFPLSLAIHENIGSLHSFRDTLLTHPFWRDTAIFFSDAFSFLAKGINGENAVLLIIGGLFTITFVLGASLLQAIFDTHHPKELSLVSVFTEPIDVSGNLQETSFESGVEKAQHIRLKTIDDILDALVDLGIGDPRIVRSTAQKKIIRIYNCRECEHLASFRQKKREDCSFTLGFLETAFRKTEKMDVSAEETRCMRAEGNCCEYFIAYGGNH